MAGVHITAEIGVVAIIIATISNSLVKYGMCIFFGSKELIKLTSIGFVSVILAGTSYIIINF